MKKEQKIEKNGLILQDVQGTPFCIVEQNLEYKIILGNDLASEKTFKSIKDAKRYIYSKPWELIGVLAVKISKTRLANEIQQEIQKTEDNSQNNH